MKIYYKSGYKHQLAKYFCIQTCIHPKTPIFTDYISLGTDGVLMIKRGYAWDGASGPTYDTKSCMRASLVHDALYQLIREGHLSPNHRKDADEHLYNICVEDGMLKCRAWLWKKAVNLCGNLANKPRKTNTAP